jgi:hypothetical protein
MRWREHSNRIPTKSCEIGTQAWVGSNGTSREA